MHEGIKADARSLQPAAEYKNAEGAIKQGCGSDTNSPEQTGKEACSQAA